MLNLDNTPQRQSFYATAAICFLRKADLLSSAVVYSREYILLLYQQCCFVSIVGLSQDVVWSDLNVISDF